MKFISERILTPMNIIYPLCSSSKGNAVYVGTRTEGLLFDCGIGIRNLAGALKLQDIPLSAIKAVFVTHEHSDHIKGLCKLSEAIPVSIYGNVPTLKELIGKKAVGPRARLKEIDKKRTSLCEMEVSCFRTSHDSADSMGYHVTFADGKRFCLCTDLGYVTEEADACLQESDFIFIESNYDRDMLLNGSYPWFLKQRIQSEKGHLSNADCAAELRRLAERGVSQFMLGHLSEENNSPEIALAASVSVLTESGMKYGSDYTISVAPRMTTGKAVVL